jgi:UDP-N-acetylmuramyl pentapeptide synthase
MDFLLKITKPDYSIFTKLDFIHVENFINQKELFAEKLKLIENSKIKSYLNYKDENLKEYGENTKINYEFFNNDNNFTYSYRKINSKFYSFLKF